MLRLRGASNFAFQVSAWVWLGTLLLPVFVPFGAACIAFILMPAVCLGFERLRRFELEPGYPQSTEWRDEERTNEPSRWQLPDASDAPDEVPEGPPVELWKRLLVQDGKGWVVFRHGTCVVVTDPAVDPVEHATQLLQEWGPVHAGTASGDFAVTPLADMPGWIVVGHPDILNYVSPEDVLGVTREAVIGLLGRMARDADAKAPEIVHVERMRDQQG